MVSKTFIHQGPKLWQELPFGIQSSKSLIIFNKRKQKSIITSYQDYYCSCFIPITGTYRFFILSSYMGILKGRYFVVDLCMHTKIRSQIGLYHIQY